VLEVHRCLGIVLALSGGGAIAPNRGMERVLASPIDGTHSRGPLDRLPVGIKTARANHSARRPVRDFPAEEQGQWMKNNMLC
jgi:hypothetical protein